MNAVEAKRGRSLFETIRKVTQKGVTNRQWSEGVAKSGMFQTMRSMPCSIKSCGVRESTQTHTREYIQAITEAGAKIAKKTNDQTLARQFVQNFLSKKPEFSNTAAGIAAVKFETWMIDEAWLGFKNLIETIVEPGAKDFIAVFQGGIDPRVWDELREGTGEFCILKQIVKAGDVAWENHERSDITVVVGTPGQDPEWVGLEAQNDGFGNDHAAKGSDQWKVTWAGPGQVFTGKNTAGSYNRSLTGARPAAVSNGSGPIGFMGEGITSDQRSHLNDVSGVTGRLRGLYSDSYDENRSTADEHFAKPNKQHHIVDSLKADGWKHNGQGGWTKDAAPSTVIEHKPGEQSFRLRKRLKWESTDQSSQPYQQTPTNYTSNWGAWSIEKDAEDRVIVQFQDGAQRKAFTLDQSLEEMSDELMVQVSNTIEAGLEETDAAIQTHLKEMCEEAGTDVSTLINPSSVALNEGHSEGGRGSCSLSERDAVIERRAKLRLLASNPQFLEESLQESTDESSVTYRSDTPLNIGDPVSEGGQVIGIVKDEIGTFGPVNEAPETYVYEIQLNPDADPQLIEKAMKLGTLFKTHMKAHSPMTNRVKNLRRQRKEIWGQFKNPMVEDAGDTDEEKKLKKQWHEHWKLAKQYRAEGNYHLADHHDREKGKIYTKLFRNASFKGGALPGGRNKTEDQEQPLALFVNRTVAEDFRTSKGITYLIDESSDDPMALVKIEDADPEEVQKYIEETGAEWLPVEEEQERKTVPDGYVSRHRVGDIVSHKDDNESRGQIVSQVVHPLFGATHRVKWSNSPYSTDKVSGETDEMLNFVRRPKSNRFAKPIESTEESTVYAGDVTDKFKYSELSDEAKSTARKAVIDQERKAAKRSITNTRSKVGQGIDKRVNDPYHISRIAHTGQLANHLEKNQVELEKHIEGNLLQFTKDGHLLVYDRSRNESNNESITVEQLTESLHQIDEAKIKEGKTELEPLQKQFVQWTQSGNVARPMGEVTIKPNLDRFAYQIGVDMRGPYFEKFKPNTDELYNFEYPVMEQALEEVDRFFELADRYKELESLHKRGLLFEGPPGGGKTSLINQVVNRMIDRGDVVFYARGVGSIIECMNAFREVEPTRPVAIVLEDMDEYIGHSEQAVLQLLDGATSQNHVLYLGTTNYINRFPERLVRPGRFDKVIHVPPPPMEGRLVYLTNKLKNVQEAGEDEIKRLAKESEGLSFGHLRELCLAVYALEENPDDVLRRLKGLPAPEPVKASTGSVFGDVKYRGQDEAITDMTGASAVLAEMRTRGWLDHGPTDESSELEEATAPKYTAHPDLPEEARKPFAVISGGRNEDSKVESFHNDKKSAVAAIGPSGYGKSIEDFGAGVHRDHKGLKKTGQSNNDWFKSHLHDVWRNGHKAAKEGGYQKASQELGLDDPDSKPAWKTTYKDYVGDEDDSNGVMKGWHRDEIKRALKFKKPVPAEVLADHPDLKTDESSELFSDPFANIRKDDAAFTKRLNASPEGSTIHVGKVAGAKSFEGKWTARKIAGDLFWHNAATDYHKTSEDFANFKSHAAFKFPIKESTDESSDPDRVEFTKEGGKLLENVLASTVRDKAIYQAGLMNESEESLYELIDRIE